MKTILKYLFIVNLLMIGQYCSEPGEHSDKNLTELLATDPNELTEAEYDKINLLTGSMEPEAYAELYPNDRFLKTIIDKTLDAAIGFAWGTWKKVDIPDAYCSDGSQYKAFVMKSKGFRNRIKGNHKKLLVYLEGGGACWDYDSCTGAGLRDAANQNGIADNFMNLGDFILGEEGAGFRSLMSPLILRNHPTGDNIETANWNKVFLPYCTGDVFSGNKENVYENPNFDPTEPESEDNRANVTYKHYGAPNMKKVIEYLEDEFYKPKKMMVAGCSAGGAGSLTNYHFIRKALKPKKSILLNDSGPIFNATGDTLEESQGNQWQLHRKISQEWNTDELLNQYLTEFPEYEDDYNGNLGFINQALADVYPKDRLAITMFKRDLNYSGYSYESFFNLDPNIEAERNEIHRLWAEDVADLKTVYDANDNLHYYLPYARDLMESHCSTVVSWTGTEYQDKNIDVSDFINDLIKKKNRHIESHEEPDRPEDYEVSDLLLDLVRLFM